MPRWKIRSPSLYPVAYGDAVEAAFSRNESIFLSHHPSLHSARQSADRFREWRMCIRNGSSLTRVYQIELNHRIRIERRLAAGRFELWVSVVPRNVNVLLTSNPSLASIVEMS